MVLQRCIWLCKAVQGYTWLYCTWLHMALQECTLLYRAVQGCARLYMVVHGCTWLNTDEQGCKWLYKADMVVKDCI